MSEHQLHIHTNTHFYVIITIDNVDPYKKMFQKDYIVCCTCMQQIINLSVLLRTNSTPFMNSSFNLWWNHIDKLCKNLVNKIKIEYTSAVSN